MLFRALFDDGGNTCSKGSIGAEVEGSISSNSAVWLVDGGAINISELCGAGICRKEVEVVCVVVSGGAKFDGSFGILTRIARAIWEQFDNIPLAVSLFLRFSLRSPFWILVIPFVWLRILASVSFSIVVDHLFLIYFESLILRSSLVPNFATSLLQTVTSYLPGSQIKDVC